MACVEAPDDHHRGRPLVWLRETRAHSCTSAPREARHVGLAPPNYRNPSIELCKERPCWSKLRQPARETRRGVAVPSRMPRARGAPRLRQPARETRRGVTTVVPWPRITRGELMRLHVATEMGRMKRGAERCVLHAGGNLTRVTNGQSRCDGESHAPTPIVVVGCTGGPAPTLPGLNSHARRRRAKPELRCPVRRVDICIAECIPSLGVP